MSDTPSEKMQAKAAEYLLSGRIKVRNMETGAFLAHAYSATQDGDPYFVKFNATGWHCDCPARVQVCAHILACQTITDFSKPSGAPAFASDPDIDKLLEGL